VAKTTAPLLSFGASGQVAKTQVYSKWRGRSYVRRHVTPSNPQTSEQSLTRDAFSFLQQVYKFGPSIFTDPWESYIGGKVLTARNAFTKFNLPLMRPATDLDDMVFSPGSLGGIPAATTTITGGNDTITVAATAPTVIPSGWTLTGLMAAYIKEQDPHAPTSYIVTADQDLVSAYSIVFAQSTPGDYVAAGWLKWLRPDGRVAYSPSVQAKITTT